MSPLLALLVTLSAGQHASQGAVGCWMSCQRHAQQPELRARLCRVCVTGGGTDAWVVALGKDGQPVSQEVLRSALGDADWRVRWGAVRASARGRGLGERQALSEWVMEASAKDETVACVTAARAAAAANLSTADFLKQAGARGPAAAARVWARRQAVREVLELEVYGADVAPRGEALAHLATFLGQTPARAVLEAMQGRPESADDAPASALKAVAEQRRTSVGRLLVQEATSTLTPRINRLFAVYSRELDTLQGALTGPDEVQRRGAVQSLRRYGPLAQRELERALGDVDGQVRLAAARGLAEAEGLPVLEISNRRLRAATDAASRRPWLDAVAREKECSRFLLGVAREASLSGELRGDALARLADCEGGRGPTLAVLSPYLGDASPPVRAGAVRALAAVPLSQSGAPASTALGDASSEVVAAAIEVVAQQRQVALGDTVAALLESPDARVRESAARALERIGRAQHVKPLARRLKEDAVSPVRVQAARALTALGGPLAAAALSEAVSQDKDGYVQHVAREGLRRLGFQR